MLRKRNVLICLTAVAFCLVGIALGKAKKVDLVPANNSGASGFAVLNYAKGADKTNINVQGRNLEDGEEYTVFLCDCDYVECEPIGIFTANKNGKAHLKVSYPGDASDQCVLVAEGSLASGSIYTLTTSQNGGPYVQIIEPGPWNDFDQLELVELK